MAMAPVTITPLYGTRELMIMVHALVHGVAMFWQLWILIGIMALGRLLFGGTGRRR